MTLAAVLFAVMVISAVSKCLVSPQKMAEKKKHLKPSRQWKMAMALIPLGDTSEGQAWFGIGGRVQRLVSFMATIGSSLYLMRSPRRRYVEGWPPQPLTLSILPSSRNGQANKIKDTDHEDRSAKDLLWKERKETSLVEGSSCVGPTACAQALCLAGISRYVVASQ